MRNALSIILASSLSAAPACAELVGGALVSLQAWNDAANNDGYAAIANGGQPVTVWRFYAAFDGAIPSSEIRVISVHAQDAPILSTPSILDATSQFPAPSDPFFDARIFWDTFITIGIDDIADGNNPIEHELTIDSDKIDGAWLSYATTSDQGTPGQYAGADDFGTGLDLVLIAQITVADAPPLGDFVEFRTNETFPSGGLFAGEIGVAFTAGGGGHTLTPMPIVRCLADLDADDMMNGADLAVLLADWGSTSSPSDLTGDGIVDGADLALLLANWGACP